MKIKLLISNKFEKNNTLKELFRVMRITLILLFVLSFQLVAKNVKGQDAIVKLETNEVSVRQLINEIENQTDYLVVYSNREVNTSRMVSLKSKAEKVSEYLNEAFDGTDIGYDFENNYIILAKKDSENKVSENKILEILSARATQQTGKTITGKVVEVEGEPIIGATIIVKGDPTKGTVTDVDGNYVLANVPENATLIFSFVGMKSEEVIIGDQTRIDIRMEYESIGLEELVAIGYGTVRKVDLSGSVSSVAGETLSIKRSSVSILDALQGTMSGVTVTRNSGEPGGAGSIRVRGITTIGDSNPLIIVDGVPGSISGLNATDIESISVLKDAASASIYGAKAAAGVIIISTKRGKSGKVELQYDLQYGFDQPTRVPKTLSAVPFMTMLNELIWNDNENSGTEYPKYSKDLIDNYVSLNAENPDQYPDTDWTQYLNNFSPRQSHSLSFSAGQERFTTRGSINFDRVESIIEDRPYINFTARTNNDFYFSKILSAHFDIQYMRSHDQRKQAVPSPYLFSQLEPLERAYWTDGRVANFRNGESRFARLLSGGSINQWNNNIGGRLALELVPVEGLKISGIFAPAISFYKVKSHYLALPMTNWDNPDLIVGHVDGVKFTRLSESRNDNNNYTLQYLTTYTNSFGDHNLDLLAGYEYYYTFSEQLGASRDQYILDNYPYLNLGPLDFRDNSGSAWEYASRSFFGRLMYNFKNKYLFQSNVRYDGSSRFHKDYRYGLFPSASFGWVMTEEPFMEDIDVLSFLKMRVSYGTLGNERIGNYPYQSTIAFSYALLYEGTDVSTSQTAYSPRYVIPDISWETTKTFDIGLDINFLNDRLQVVADYYNKKTTDMLLALEIPNYIGLSNPNQNTGSMKTKGWELGIRYNNNIGDLNYAISGNLSDFKSTMGYLGGTEFLGDQVKFEGSEFNEWYGYKADGIYQTEEEVSSSATINNRVRPGDIKYKDISGPEGVPDGKISPEYDRVLLGGSLPRYEYGGNIQLDYKNFDLNLIFQGIGKQNSYLSNNMVEPFIGGILAVPSFIEGNYWSKYNTAEQNRKVFYPRLSQVAAGAQNRNNGNNYVTSDYWLFDGSYFRMKNIIIGYSFPNKLTDQLNIKKVRVYGNLSNLFSIDHFPQGWDPEGSITGYFMIRSFLLGVSVTF